MLKIFRRIRQKLLVDGNLKRYLIYAIGETLLVVIGILIALQINNWNEARKNKIDEIQYLNRLIEDLEHDQNDLATTIMSNAVNMILAEDALRKLGADTSILQRGRAYQLANDLVTFNGEEVSYKDSIISRQFELKYFGHQLTRLTHWRRFDLTQTTINDLLSTGKIEVITDQRLKENVLDYYASMQSNLGKEGTLLSPHHRYLNDVLSELGIPPWSKLSAPEVQVLNQNDHRLIIAIYNIYDANHQQVSMNYVWRSSLYNHVQKINKNINQYLN